ncbi:MAG: lysophospholipid acyltransferase family protein [Alphaproteobacteria bacterium]|nr:lysophospholipid acyltransferase family protein [Alphaproteobacteria bacterium]
MKRVLKKILASAAFQAFLAWMGYLYIKFVYLTCRWKRINLECIDRYVTEDKPFIICFWHGRLAMLPAGWRWKKPFQMLLSAHRDGQLIAGVLGHFGMDVISGSTTRGGAKAALALVKAVRSGVIIGITPDGPKGPAYKVSPGIVTISKLVQADIIPVSYSVSRHRALKTWDRFHFPLPFGRGVFAVSDPIPYPKSDKDLKSCQDQIEKSLNNITNKSDEEILYIN